MVKRAATSPAPTRRTPRKSAGTSPARLGISDNWGEGSATTWTSEDKAEKEKVEAEKVKAREVAMAKQNKADAAKKSMMTKIGTSYKALNKKKPALVAAVQGALFSGTGEVVASALKGTAQDAVRITAFVVWGAMISFVLRPYLAKLAKLKLSKNKTADALLKVVLDQATMSLFLTALFLSYFKFVQEGMAMTGLVAYLTTEIVARWTTTAAFWSSVNFANFMLVPPSQQLMMVNVAGLFWSIIAAYTI